MRSSEEIQALLNRPRTKSQRRRAACTLLLVGTIFLTGLTVLVFTLVGAVLRAISTATD